MERNKAENKDKEYSGSTIFKRLVREGFAQKEHLSKGLKEMSEPYLEREQLGGRTANAKTFRRKSVFGL